MDSVRTSTERDWRQEWHDFGQVTYLDAAAQAPMPKVSLRAVETALEWKKFPHHLPESAYFELPARVRSSIARLIDAQPDEIALTTGASSGTAAVANGIDWKPGDEISIARGEFPLQIATWKPLEAREGTVLKIIAPRNRFFSYEDFVAALTPRTRLISASLARFNDAALLDSRRLSEACHKNGTLLLLDASQSCGAIPLNARESGADFITCAGYKWLLGPYGTGFLWTRREAIDQMRPGPFYWMAAVKSAHEFSALTSEDLRPVPGARRWDTAETASYFNMAALDASLRFLLDANVSTIERHIHGLIGYLYQRLPKNCAPSSPVDSRMRGPFGCFAARSLEETSALYDKLKSKEAIVSLREGSIRVAPHLYNTKDDIDKLVAALSA